MDHSELIRDIVQRVVDRLKDEPVYAGAPPKEGATESYAGIFPTIDEAVQKAKVAQQQWAALPLEHRSRIIAAIRASLRTQVTRLSEMAVRETALGRVDDKINKNLLAIDKTPGIEFLHPEAWSGDHGLTIAERAPYGIIGSITPCTNPSETIINNAIGMIAGGNAVVFNPHPTSKYISFFTISQINKTIADNGGPMALLAAAEEPTIENANLLMKHPEIRLLVVTGGPAVVRAAMNSGKKVIAAGPGNPPVVVDETADLVEAGIGLVKGASFDNNIVCVAEKEVFAVWSIADKLKECMLRHGAYEVKGQQLRQLEDKILDGDHASKAFIGKDAPKILASIGIKVGPEVRLVIAETDFHHPFVQDELMMPVLPIVRVRDVDEGIRLAKAAEHGYRHTAGIYSRNIEAMDAMAKAMDCSIFVKNAPHYAGLGFGGEGYTTFTIASPTGEGLTTVLNFTRVRRCTLANYFRIV